MEEREHSYTVGGTVNWGSPCGKQYGAFSKKLRMGLPYDPAIPLLGMYLKINKHTHAHKLIPKATCTPVFIAALFTTAKIWKQPKCPSTDEWVKKM